MNIQRQNLAKKKKCIPVPTPEKMSGEIMRLQYLNRPEPLLQEYCAMPVSEGPNRCTARGGVKRKPESI